MSFESSRSQADTVVPGESASPHAVSAVRGRTTTLPGFSEAGLTERALERYQVVRPLGSGGMGEVALVQDHDIDRTVAVKYLHADLAAPNLIARFVEEIRTVGHLEHPNIVPIHDAGRDEAGRYFFVMKHIEGETLESIIDKLRAGDPAYVARYTFLQRVEIFIGILNALKFAHEKGYVHRDVKPANVMVGHSGEVVLMDWGITKSLLPAPAALPAEGAVERPRDARLVATQFGAVIGTPEYMSPEQAAGRNDQVDARSDLYSATVLFHELMFLEHYLDGCNTIEEKLAGVQLKSPKGWKGYGRYPLPPGPYLYIAVKGMQKDPAKRFQSADELIERLRRVQEGTAPVQCAVTFMRRGATELTRFVDRNPMGAMVAFGAATLAALASFTGGIYWLAHVL
ncbi:MAG TPA: serine/threonine-protein kinase [Myxococcales bacterium]|nr:serine/threonine-protein kinase [Myxococcales bacterium]